MSEQKIFNVEDCNREPSIAVNLADSTNLVVIPDIGKVKDYGRKMKLPYVVPRYLGLTHFYICTCYKSKKGENWVTQINPIILSTEGLVYVEETQHGVEGTYLVPRHPRLLAAWTEAGSLKPVQRELMGINALQFQQALHAAQGLFISDFGMRIDDNEAYLNGTDEERKEIIDAYFKALKESYEAELKSNKDTNDYIKASEFLAEKMEADNARNGVLPEQLQKELNLEADKAEN
jgi:hypothetical protein